MKTKQHEKDFKKFRCHYTQITQNSTEVFAHSPADALERIRFSRKHLLSVSIVDPGTKQEVAKWP